MKKKNIATIILFVFATVSFAHASDFKGAMTGAVGYDTLAGQISSDSEKPEGEKDIVFSTSLNLKLQEIDPYNLEYRFYKNWYKDQKDLNLYGQTLKGGCFWTKGNNDYLLAGVYDHYVWNGESYLEKTALKPSYIRVSGRKWLSISLEYERSRFLKNSDRTGSRFGLGVRIPILVGKLNRDMELEIWRASENTNSELYRHDETGMEMVGRHDIFRWIDTLTYGVRIMSRDYDPALSKIEDRKDTREEYSIGISRGVDDGIQIRLDGRWIANESNIRTEDYSKAVYTLSVIRTF